jgi:hypothetical protein
MFEGVLDPKFIAWSGRGRGCRSEQRSNGYRSNCRSDCELKVRRLDRHPASPCVFSWPGPLLGALLIQQRCVITGDIHSMPLLAAMFFPGRHRNPDWRVGWRRTARPPTATPLPPSVKVATAARRVVTLSAQSARPPRPQSTPIRHIGSGASHGTVPDIQCLILSAWSLRYKWRGGCANVA